MTVLMSADQFRGELRAKRTPAGGVYRVSVAQPLPVAGAERTLRFCFSDDSVDRMGDTIAAAGWDIADFMANPVALWAHASSAPPIGGARNVGVEGNRLLGDIEFAPPETYAFADTIYRLLLGKFLRAVSVGFLPTRYAFVDNDPFWKSACARCRPTRTRCNRRGSRASTRGRWSSGPSERLTARAGPACRSANWNAYVGQQRNRR